MEPEFIVLVKGCSNGATIVEVVEENLLSFLLLHRVEVVVEFMLNANRLSCQVYFSCSSYALTDSKIAY